MEHVEQFQIALSYVKPPMMTSDGIGLWKRDCKTLNGILLKLLIELFHLHIHFVASRLVFEGIIELFSNRTLENEYIQLISKYKKKQHFVYSCCFSTFHTSNWNHKEADNEYFRLCGTRSKIEYHGSWDIASEKTWLHRSCWWHLKHNNWRQFLIIQVY